MAQTTIDLRAGFASALERARQAEEVPAPAPAQPDAPRISQARRDLVHQMMLERYPAEVVAERFPKIDWDNMTVADFKDRFDKLKAIPRIDGKGGTAQVAEHRLFDGYFTVVLDQDTHRTIRVRTQDSDASFKPGQTILGYLKGTDNYNDYVNFGHVDARTGKVVIWFKHRENAALAEAVKVLTGDVRAAAQAYFKMSRNCVACGTKITNPDSIADAEGNGGLGPVCKGKASW